MPATELVAGETTYYIVGTAHVSQRSVDEVRDVIRTVVPDIVCVELDKTRHATLVNQSAFRDLDVTKVVREGRTLYLLAHLALAAYQKRIGASLGVKPGAELLAAIDAARELGIPVALIDRDIAITLKRTWSNLGLVKRALMLVSLVVGFATKKSAKDEPITAQTIEDLKEPKALSDMLTELGNAVPEIKAPLIDERDAYLASKLVEAGAGKRKVVAVVGAAHVPGMRARFGQPIDRDALEAIPPPSTARKIISWLVPALFLAALVATARHTSVVALMRAWILPTSIAAGACTLLAGGTLASVLAAMLASPFAALYPPLSTGMIVGVVEASRRRPTAADRERLTDDTQSLAGFRRNPVTRILLVAVASGIGTAIGFWIGVVRVALA